LDRRKPSLADLSPPPRKNPQPPAAENDTKRSGEAFYAAAKREMERNRPTRPPERPQPRPGTRRTAPQARPMRPPARRRPTSPPKKRNPIRINPLVTRIAGIVIAIAAFGTIFFFVGSRVFAFNAIAIHVDGEHKGYIAYDSNLDLANFHRHVINFIENYDGTEIRLNATITAEAARRVANRNMEEQEAMFRALRRELSYQISARAIYVNGVFEVLVRTPSCVSDIERAMQNPWETPNTIEARFVADWRTEPRFVYNDDPELRSVTEAINMLDRRVPTDYLYRVRSGDNLTIIARNFETTPQEIALNNNIFVDSRLAIGQTLTLRTMQPLLAVITVEETEVLETIPRVTETIPNPDMGESMTNVIQEGNDGLQRIASRTSFINGVQTGEIEILEAEILQYPTTRIVEEGTRPDSIIERR